MNARNNINGIGAVPKDESFTLKHASLVAAQKALPHQHFIAQNIANGSKTIERPDPLVSIFNFHYAAPPDAVTLNYDL